MGTLQIDLDRETGDALTSLAIARGKTPADLVAEIVARYVKIYDIELPANGQQAASRDAEADPLDAMVGTLDIDPIDDIDEVIYGR